MRVRVVISPKHPSGVAWAEMPRGWTLLNVPDVIDTFGILDDFLAIDATIVLSDALSAEIADYVPEAVDVPVVNGCRTCE